MSKSFERPLSFADLWYLRERDEASSVAIELGTLWDEECRLHAVGERSLQRVTLRWAYCQLVEVLLWKAGWLVANILGHAIVLRELLAFLERGTDELWVGILLALAFAVTELMRSVLVNQHWMSAVMMGIRVRGALRTLIYDKVLRLRNPRVAVGQVVNLSQGDAQRVFDAANYFQFLISTPVSLIVIIILQIWVLGPATLVGFAVLFILTPLQERLGSWYGTLRRKTVAITDRRVRIMNEVLNGIRLIKLYAWEAAFATKVSHIRKAEIQQLSTAAVVRAANFVLSFAAPVLVTLVTFAVHVLTSGQPLRASQAFVVLSLFNVARFPLSVLPIASRNVSEAIVGLRRIGAFLQLPEVLAVDLPEVAPEEASPAASGSEGDAASPPPRPVVLQWEAASLAWTLPEETAMEEMLLQPFRAQDKKPSTAAAAAGAPPTPTSSPVPSVISSSPPTSDERAAPSRGELRDITASIRQGELVGLVGRVGSGKSSLLASLTGQLRKMAGSVRMRGSLAMVSQTPWVFNGTVKQNVLFGRELNEARYAEAVRVCELTADLAALPAGDNTEIGERGINLSGGQRARVALARAVYADADIVILDSVLSAVDVHVAKKLWNNCVRGVLRGKTVLITTHMPSLLPQCDRVLVMDGGRLAHSGAFPDLLAAGLDLSTYGLVAEGSESEEADDEDADAGASDSAAASASEVPKADTSAEAVAEVSHVKPVLEPESGAAKPSSTMPSTDGRELAVVAATKPASSSTARITTDEDRAVGSVSAQTFVRYFRASGGAWLGVLTVLLVFIGRGSKMVSDWWVSFWVEDGVLPTPRFDVPFYIWIYAATALGLLVTNMIQGAVIAVITLNASRKLHDRVFTAVMSAQMSWFDSTPTGRILNRFSTDLDQIDVGLPQTLQTCAELLIQCFLAVILVAIALPWFLIPLVPILWLFYRTTNYFRHAARELRRLDGISRSPMLSHLQSSVQGLGEIRAFGEMPRYSTRNSLLTDDNTRAFFAFYAANRWVGFRLDMLTLLVAVLAALLAVLTRDSMEPGVAGLVLSYALQLAGILQYSTRLLAETEALFTSVERIEYYVGNAPQEPVTVDTITDPAALESMRSKSAVMMPARRPPSTVVAPEIYRLVAAWDPAAWPTRLAGWPWAGAIEVRDLRARYRADLPMVINGLSFSLPAGKTLGVVGRTGSGKTTLIQCLFRLLEPSSGSIHVDGVSLGAVPLSLLRSSITCIPQDPTLFTGPLRYNIDPFHEHDDDSCWSVLEQSGMAENVRKAGGLDADVSEGGSNFSAGQRQLLCLARALLRRAKVLVLDEATSQTDTATDAMVQRVIRSLRDSTVLVIAHRLETVVDADLILALDGGCLAEFGSPAALLGEPTTESDRSTVVPGTRPGMFAAMVAEAGPEAEATLRAMARSAAASPSPVANESE